MKKTRFFFENLFNEIGLDKVWQNAGCSFLWSATPLNMFGDSNPVWTEQGFFFAWDTNRDSENLVNIYKSVITWQRKTSFYPSRLERGFFQQGSFRMKLLIFTVYKRTPSCFVPPFVGIQFFFFRQKQSTTPNWFKPSREAFFSSPKHWRSPTACQQDQPGPPPPEVSGEPVFQEGENLWTFENRRTKNVAIFYQRTRYIRMVFQEMKWMFLLFAEDVMRFSQGNLYVLKETG